MGGREIRAATGGNGPIHDSGLRLFPKDYHAGSEALRQGEGEGDFVDYLQDGEGDADRAASGSALAHPEGRLV